MQQEGKSFNGRYAIKMCFQSLFFLLHNTCNNAWVYYYILGIDTTVPVGLIKVYSLLQGLPK